MSAQLIDYIDDLESAVDVDDLRRRAVKALDACGVSSFGYVGFNPPCDDPKSAVMSTYPVEWLSHYSDQQLVYIDPTVIVARRTLRPFDLDQINRIKGLSREQVRLNRDAHDFGLGKLISIPIHGPLSDFAVFVAACDESDKQYQQNLERRKRELHYFGIVFHSTFQKFLGSPEAFSESQSYEMVRLSSRETECLLWSARGKTAWETGEILGISDRTVNEYIAGAMKKLGCRQKTLAITKAIVGGYISP